MDVVKDAALSANLPVYSITKLYWNTYPYKIVTKSPIKDANRISKYTNSDWFSSEQIKKRRKIKTAFRAKCAKHCPDNDDWKVTDTYQSLHFYFINAEDAAYFIRNNKKRINEVHAPASPNEISALQSEINGVLRTRKFWDEYDLCIIFRRENLAETDILDEWVTEHFGYDAPNIGYYSYSEPRRLYVKTELDLIYVTMAMKHMIQRVEKCILKENIDE